MNLNYTNILGEEDLKNFFRRSVERGQVSHAYILSGEKGSGKRMIMEAFSAALLCDHPVHGEACGTCPSCGRFSRHNHPDFVEVLHEKPSVISVKEIREQVIDVISMGPIESKYKIYFIEDAELLNAAAQNALLKTIEEPPSFAVIILLTDNRNAFLPTILSRCVKLEIRPVPEETIRTFLMKNYGQTDYSSEAAAAFAQGNVGRAIDLTSSGEFQERKERIIRLMTKVSHAHDYEFQEDIQELGREKDTIDDTLDLLQIWYRDVLLYKSTETDRFLIFKSERSLIRKMADSSSYRYLNRAFAAIEECRNRLNAHVNFELAMGLLLTQLEEIQNG